MKVLIVADIEGASGVDDYRQIAPFLGSDYEKCIDSITSDINAAVRGLKRAGVRTIDIFDGHGDGGNLRQEKIEAGAAIIRDDLCKLAKSGYDALLLIGQHACAGTLDGFLSHSYGTDYCLRINKKPIGEAANISWLFGAFDVPVILVTGDDATIRESKELLPGVEGVTVKYSRSRLLTDCVPIEEVKKEIEEKAFNSAKKIKEAKPFKINGKISLEIQFIRPESANMMMQIPGFELIDSNTVLFESDDYIDIYKATIAANLISSVCFTQSIVGEAYSIAGVSEFLINKMRDKVVNWAINNPPFPIVKY